MGFFVICTKWAVTRSTYKSSTFLFDFLFSLRRIKQCFFYFENTAQIVIEKKKQQNGNMNTMFCFCLTIKKRLLQQQQKKTRIKLNGRGHNKIYEISTSELYVTEAKVFQLISPHPCRVAMWINNKICAGEML